MMFLAEAVAALPDPNHFASIGWAVVVLTGLMMSIKTALDLYRDHFATTPAPHLTYQTIAAAEKSNQELTKRIEDAVQKIETFSSANYDARKRMHKKINHFANAFHYLAGRMASDGRTSDSEHIRSLIEKAYEDEGE